MSAHSKENTYYDILEITATATNREIQEAYKRAKATYANDNPALYSMFTREEARELMDLIEEAYTILNDPRAREAYDLHLKGFVDGQPSHNLTQLITDNPEFVVPEAQAVPYSAIEEAQWQTQPAAFRDDGAGNVKVKVRPQPTNGVGQTKYGTYEIKADMEEVIRQASVFDGEFLKQVRVYKNISLDNMSAATKVSRTYLIAVENMDLQGLPAPVFVRGFISHMARVLGLNEKKATDSYMKLLKDKSASA